MTRPVPAPSDPYVDAGPWHKPEAVASRIGRGPKEVRALCADKAIDHQRIESPGGRVRYLISEQAVHRFLRRSVIKAVA